MDIAGTGARDNGGGGEVKGDTEGQEGKEGAEWEGGQG